MSAVRRWWPLAIPLLALAALERSGLLAELSWNGLARHQVALRGWTAAHPALAPAAYAAVYAACVAISLPIGVLLTAVGGLLFGTWLGGSAAVIGATAGATGLFLMVRAAFADFAERRLGTLLTRVRPALERDGVRCLLALRLAPVVPFWVTNIAPALTGMRLAPYVAATFVGVAPATFVFASVGAGMADVIAAGRRPDLSAAASPSVVLPLLGLALLVMAPAAIRAARRAHG